MSLCRIAWLEVALSCVFAPHGLAAQRAEAPRWGVGAAAGPAFPVAEFSATDNPGAAALVYFSYRLEAAFSLGLDVGAMWTPHKRTGHSEVYDMLAGVVWRPVSPASAVQPFILGSVGGVAVDIDNPAKAHPALSGGIGVTLGRGTGRVFALARYVRILGSNVSLAYVPVTVGYATRTP